MADPRGLIIAAPNSGSGKTVVTLGLLAALRARGLALAPAKTGPDYIDPYFLARAADAPCVNLDPWAMSHKRLATEARAHAGGADLLVVEGVMGLFDGAADGTGSTGDLAAMLNLPVVLVVDASRQAQSVAPLVAGFAHWRPDVKIRGVIFNRVGSERHAKMLKKALERTGIPCLGTMPRNDDLAVPERHLGLVLPGEIKGAEAYMEKAHREVREHVDLDALLALAAPLPDTENAPGLPPLGQRIAVARDAAFAFCYPHWLMAWRRQGAEVKFFSPLANEPPPPDADAIYLPGGYPELHGEKLSAANHFMAGLKGAKDRGALIYGECGGFMVMGERLIDREGVTHVMAGLLPGETRIDRPRRVLGYRRLRHAGILPFPEFVSGHEFHYSSGVAGHLTPLFTATDALGEEVAPMGAIEGRVMGSYAHVIDVMP